ncbi:MAG: dienelactone hydrolase family protein [Sterolibacteriaceae bacterium]|nr:dienelactone hydrolase family protein [Sterolibacteriaceae bacterium]
MNPPRVSSDHQRSTASFQAVASAEGLILGVSLERMWLGQVPALVVRPDGMDAQLPTVLWFHGLTADKELHQPELERFAASGFLAVGIDSAGHGERRMPDLDSRFSQPREVTGRLFYALVAQTVAEVPRIIDTLIDRGMSDPNRIGAAGVSMGACIVYGAVATEPRICGAVALLGSPEWTHPDSPHCRADSFYPTALLSITAELDEVVPPVAARNLHDKLAARYAARPERLMYRQIAGAPHFLTPEDWLRAVGEAIAWLQRFAK